MAAPAPFISWMSITFEDEAEADTTQNPTFVTKPSLWRGREIKTSSPEVTPVAEQVACIVFDALVALSQPELIARLQVPKIALPIAVPEFPIVSLFCVTEAVDPTASPFGKRVPVAPRSTILSD